LIEKIHGYETSVRGKDLIPTKHTISVFIIERWETTKSLVSTILHLRISKNLKKCK